MYDTVIFDLDGTLLNTIDDIAAAVQYAQKKYGFPVHTVDEVKKHVGNGLRLLMHRSIPEGENNPDFDKIFADFSEYYQKHCQVKTRAYDGILDLIKELKKRNIKMAIVSNKNYKAVESLKDIYFESLIDVALGENEAAGIKKKPAKDMVMSALEKLDSTQEKSIYVVDSEVDIQNAVNSGLDCILVSWGFRTKDILEKLTYKKIIDEPMELLDVIA